MNKKEQLAEFAELAEPVLEWLKNGAPHTVVDRKYGEVGFNMDIIFLHDEESVDDYQDQYCDTIMCIAGSIAHFNEISKIETIAKQIYSEYEKEWNESCLKYGSRSQKAEFDYNWKMQRSDTILETMFPCLDLHNLFYPGDELIPYNEIHPHEAHLVLEHFCQTGEVTWHDILNH